MPDESDRPIEQQLREYAQRRRDAAGKDAFALHPVTRNALQVEVERAFGRQARQGGRRQSWLAVWWPRLAFGAGGLAVVTLLAVTLIPQGGNQAVGDLAKVEQASVPQPDQPVVSGGGKGAADASLEVREADAALAVADAAVRPAQRQEFQFTNSKVQVASRATPELTAPSPVSPSPRNLPLSASGNRERRETAAARSAPATVSAVPAPVMPPLQGNFQVVILDDRISLVDADQSSYSGRLEPIDPASVGGAAPARTLSFEERYYRFVQNGLAQQVPVAARFVLTGTNRSTRLPVQVVGQMVTRTQAVPAAARSVTTTGVFLQINATATMNGVSPVLIDARAQP